jgi:hypothetical protein
VVRIGGDRAGYNDLVSVDRVRDSVGLVFFLVMRLVLKPQGQQAGIMQLEADRMLLQGVDTIDDEHRRAIQPGISLWSGDSVGNLPEGLSGAA